MLHHLLPSLEDVHIVFNLFNYITVRSAGAMTTGLILTLLLGRPVIEWLKRKDIVDVPRSKLADTPPGDRKANMGGVLIVGVGHRGHAALGRPGQPVHRDRTRHHALDGRPGLPGRLSQGRARLAAGVVAGMEVVRFDPARTGTRHLALELGPASPAGATTTNLPLFDEWLLVFTPVAYLLWVTVVINGATHAVNMTDGLDGLAPGLAAIAMGTFGVFAYVIGRVDTSAYLGLLYLPGAGELAVFAAAITGTVLGFLWFNAQPARVIMGDTGSLALGGALGGTAVLLKAELLLVAVGGVFVAEAASVIIQTRYFKYTKWRHGEGRRVFKCAPIHHHFQMLGWRNEQIVVRFWILGLLCAMVGFATLKLR